MATVYWREAYLDADWPLFASLEPLGPIFATVCRVEVPRGGWRAIIRHRGWDLRLEATFSTIARAQHAVERWTAVHESVVRRALGLPGVQQSQR